MTKWKAGAREIRHVLAKADRSYRRTILDSSISVLALASQRERPSDSVLALASQRERPSGDFASVLFSRSLLIHGAVCFRACVCV